MKRLALLLAFAAAPPLQQAGLSADVPRGPAEIRDGQLLAQPRLTLPAVSPQTTPKGRWAFQLSGLWSNSFSWMQDVAGEEPEERFFLVDGEALDVDLTLRRGIGTRLDVALRVPLHARGGGALDGFIDWWHQLVNAPDGERPAFLQDAFRVEGVTVDGAPFSWNEHGGTGLGDVELEARHRVRDGAGTSPSLALVARASFPTGTGPFGGNGFGGGAQAVLDAPLGSSFDVYGGLGFTAQETGPVRGVRYEPLRAHGFVALEWRPWSSFSLVGETNVASRLVENVEGYPGLHWVVNVTGRIDLGERARVDLGFTENVRSQLTTTDFALHLALSIRP